VIVFGFFERLVRPYPEVIPKPAPTSILRFIWQCTKGMRRYIAVLIFLAALIGAFEAALFAMMGKIVDWLSNVSPDQFWEQDGAKLIVLAIVILASIGAVALSTTIRHQTLAGNFPMRLRWNFHRLILNQSMNFFQDEFAGRVSAKVMQTALAVRDVCLMLGDILVFVFIYFFTMVGIVGSFNTWFLLPFLLWFSFYSLGVYWFVPKLARTAKAQADARAMMTGRITDAYTNIATVKFFSHVDSEAEYARSAMQEFMVTVHAQMRLVSQFEIVNYALSMLLILSTTGVALHLWTQEVIGVGAIAAATAMSLRLNGMSHWIMWEMAMLFENVGTVQDGINTLSQAPLVVDKPNARHLEVSKGRIQFQNIGFYYDENVDKEVIQDFNLTIQPGERIGIVGRSGAGKSTLVNLLLRFYDLRSGQILIDGQDIAYVTQESLRAQIGMVTQDTSLLHRTVRENIIYGKPGASIDEMIAAAKQAEAHEFIRELVDKHQNSGYDTLVGERGVKLSGGQRQRIALARVMLKDAPILLLDEATSALDSEDELAIQSNLNKLMKGKTVVAIAHRLSTIAAMDRLIVMDEGGIVEEGTHTELLEKKGLYAQLWAHQSGGFLREEW